MLFIQKKKKFKEVPLKGKKRKFLPDLTLIFRSWECPWEECPCEWLWEPPCECPWEEWLWECPWELSWELPWELLWEWPWEFIWDSSSESWSFTGSYDSWWLANPPWEWPCPPWNKIIPSLEKKKKNQIIWNKRQRKKGYNLHNINSKSNNCNNCHNHSINIWRIFCSRRIFFKKKED